MLGSSALSLSQLLRLFKGLLISPACRACDPVNECHRCKPSIEVAALLRLMKMCDQIDEASPDAPEIEHCHCRSSQLRIAGTGCCWG